MLETEAHTSVSLNLLSHISVDDGCILSWFCTLDNNHTETNEDVEPMIDQLDEAIRTTVYFSSPLDWERLLDELQKTLHKGNTLRFIGGGL